MKIIQIIKEGTTIYGLGDDNVIYYWNMNLQKPEWTEYKS